MKRKIDWGLRFALLVPYSRSGWEDHTHWHDETTDAASRRRTITRAVRSHGGAVGTPFLPTVSDYALERLHASTRRRVWRALYSKGYRVVQIRIAVKA